MSTDTLTAVLPVALSARTMPTAQGCQVWTGAVQSSGYGALSVGGRVRLAHRHAVEVTRGPIPAGQQVDHLCRVKLCVNPEHLEVVSQAENMRRRGQATTHCPAGHAYTAGNTRRNSNGHRHCRTCETARRTASREAGAIRVATLLLACTVVSVVILGGTAAFGHLILWLAGIDSAPLLATALVGLGLTGVPVYALVVIVDDARKRRDRRARVLSAIGDLRVPAQRSARVLTHR